MSLLRVPLGALLTASLLASTSAHAAEATVDRAPVPARFGAPLPVPDAEGRLTFTDAHPPAAHVFSQLRRGDPATLAAVATSVAASSASRADAHEAWLTPVSYQTFSGCAAHIRAADDARAPDKPLFWTFAAIACDPAAWTGVSSRAPLDVRIARPAARASRGLPPEAPIWSREVEAHVAKRLSTADQGAATALSEAALTAGAPSQTLLSIHQGLSGDVQKGFALGWSQSADQALRKTYCASLPRPYSGCQDPPELDLDNLARQPAPVLATCVQGGSYLAEACLSALHHQDPTHARTLCAFPRRAPWRRSCTTPACCRQAKRLPTPPPTPRQPEDQTLPVIIVTPEVHQAAVKAALFPSSR